MLDIQNVTKSYRAYQALRGVTLQAHSGEVFGLLGPNGAGRPPCCASSPRCSNRPPARPWSAGTTSTTTPKVYGARSAS